MSDRRIFCNPAASSCQITLPNLGVPHQIIGPTNIFGWTYNTANVGGGTPLMPALATLDYVIENLGSNTANTLSVCAAGHPWFTNMGTTNLVIPNQTSVRLTTDGANIFAEFAPMTIAGLSNGSGIAPSNGVGTNVTIYSPGSAGGSALTVSAHGLSNATNYVVNVTNDTGASLFNISSNGNINLGSQTVSATSLELNFSWPTLLAGEARTFNNSNDFLTISASNSAAIKDSGINIFGPVWSNGFASLATGGNTITVNATGLTNTETTNLRQGAAGRKYKLPRPPGCAAP